MIDVPTLKGWLDQLGLAAASAGEAMLEVRLRPAEGAPSFPPFFIQCSQHWVLLSMLPMLGPSEHRPEDLNRRLLAANRDMRVAKFAIDAGGDIVLCAELPTESLDFSELADAVDLMTRYARFFSSELARR